MTSKRFMTGAICPHCQLHDTVAISTMKDGQRLVVCVACGWRQPQADYPSQRAHPSEH